MIKSFVAVDIGNSLIKVGWFENLQTADEPMVDSVWTFQEQEVGNPRWQTALELCSADATWWLASVNQSGLDRVQQWLRDHRPQTNGKVLESEHLPMSLEGLDPQQVGVDRVLAAMGARSMQVEPLPAIVIDLGTAVTVDAVSATGHFLGGVIMPGLSVGGKALADLTDRLPQVTVDHSGELPPVIGKSTDEAITAGLAWGLIGALETVVRQQREILGESTQVFITGGAAVLAGHLPFETTTVNDLCFRGMTVIAKSGIMK